jgi:hypothetical protein
MDYTTEMEFDVTAERLIEKLNASVMGEMEPRLIGLSGPARSGKDTIGSMLQSAYYVQTLSFAEPIREGLRGIMGLTDEHFHGTLKEVTLPWLGKSPRQLMQTLGTEWGRAIINDNIWLILAGRKIDEWQELREHVVITDVRFENEATFIRERGGVVWHIRRGDAPKVNAHASESGIAVQPEDVVIYNNGTLEDLFDNVAEAF